MGFEAIANTTDSNRNQEILRAGAAKASVALLPPVPADADLRAVNEAWPALPVLVRAAIVAITRDAIASAKSGPEVTP